MNSPKWENTFKMNTICKKFLPNGRVLSHLGENLPSWACAPTGREYESASKIKKYEFTGKKKNWQKSKDRGIDAILANIYTVYDIYFSVIRSRMLPLFISDVKDNTRHLFLASYGAESRMFPSFISDVKDKHPTFILASYGTECYHHAFPTVKAITQHLF